MAYYANAYELNRVYGGPEEGGWWFTTFKPMACSGWRTKARASIKLHHMMKVYKMIQGEQEWGLYSVNYSGGSYHGVVEDKEASFSPEGPIHYE